MWVAGWGCLPNAVNVNGRICKLKGFNWQVALNSEPSGDNHYTIMLKYQYWVQAGLVFLKRTHYFVLVSFMTKCWIINTERKLKTEQCTKILDLVLISALELKCVGTFKCVQL